MVAAPPRAPVDAVHDLVRRGRIRTAIDELLGVLADPGTPAADTGAATALLTECHLAQGELGCALALAGDLLAAGDLAPALHALGELASASGEPELAIERFHAAAHGVGADDLLVPWRAGAALALLRVGQRREALDLARTQHDLALAAGTPYDVALALRVLATTDPSVEAARQRAPRLRAALRVLDGVEAGRLRAQIETDLAGLLLLTGADTEALALLRSAEAYAGREDLWPLQSRVRRLLERMGEVPRRAWSEALAALTAGERRVALLTLDGLSNRQVAEQLTISVKAVEGHLSRIYRKLGLTSRVALAASLAGR